MLDGDKNTLMMIIAIISRLYAIDTIMLGKVCPNPRPTTREEKLSEHKT